MACFYFVIHRLHNNGQVDVYLFLANSLKITKRSLLSKFFTSTPQNITRNLWFF
jgi:hypothetical protein